MRSIFRIDFHAMEIEEKEVGDGLIDRVYIGENRVPREAFVRAPDHLWPG